MARITVEDCLDHVDNRFELVLLATKRARQLAFGTAEPLVPWENDKATVVALREIADGLVDEQVVEEAQQRAEPDVVTAEIDLSASFENGSIDLTEDFNVTLSSETHTPAQVAQPDASLESASEEEALQASPEQQPQDNRQED